jgi:hypothetical protein
MPSRPPGMRAVSQNMPFKFAHHVATKLNGLGEHTFLSCYTCQFRSSCMFLTCNIRRFQQGRAGACTVLKCSQGYRGNFDDKLGRSHVLFVYCILTAKWIHPDQWSLPVLPTQTQRGAFCSEQRASMQEVIACIFSGRLIT